MDVQCLRSFVEVAAQRSVSRAAVRLGYAQPTVTQHVQRAERFVGGALFVRSHDGLSLTSLGLQVLPLAQVAIFAVDEMSGRQGSALTAFTHSDSQ